MIAAVASMKSTAVVVVLLDAGGDGEDIGIEDDILGREADLVDQHAVSPLADLDLCAPGCGNGLAGFVEGHDHHGGSHSAGTLSPGG